MFKSLLVGLTLLHLGPGIAFALLAFGCEGPEPWLRGVCGPRPLASFAWLTVGSWFVLGVGLVAWQLLQRSRRLPSAGSALRVWTLLSLLTFGALLAAAGFWLTDSAYAVLAVPGALAAGWLMLANPEACAAGSMAGGPARH
jgi:hypothetical protein